MQGRRELVAVKKEKEERKLRRKARHEDATHPTPLSILTSTHDLSAGSYSDTFVTRVLTHFERLSDPWAVVLIP